MLATELGHGSGNPTLISLEAGDPRLSPGGRDCEGFGGDAIGGSGRVIAKRERNEIHKWAYFTVGALYQKLTAQQTTESGS